jgi:hypothetical protein
MQEKYFSVLIICCSILFACTNKPKPTKNLEDIRPKSNRKERIKEFKSEKDTLRFYLKSYTQDSVLLEIENITTIESKHFINRFQPLKYSFFKLHKKDSVDNIEHFFWEFKDSSATKNAFYNWLDIEKSSKIFASKSLSKDFFIALITEKNIDFFYSKKKMEILKLIRYVKFNRNTVEFKFIIIQKLNSKAFWFTFDGQKLTPIITK